jgi:hypothetical protein
MKKMVCAIFERRPRTQRNIRDSRSAQLIDRVEFDGKDRRVFEIAKRLKDDITDRGYEVAGTPYQTNHAEYDWVAYVQPKGVGSPTVQRTKKKPVSVGVGGVSRRISLPTRGQKVQKSPSAVSASRGPSTKTAVVGGTKAKPIPPRKRPAKLPLKRHVLARQAEEK